MTLQVTQEAGCVVASLGVQIPSKQAGWFGVLKPFWCLNLTMKVEKTWYGWYCSQNHGSVENETSACRSGTPT